MKKPIIIDCDPGLDDVVTLVMGAVMEEVDIRAITTVAGNQTLEVVTDNTLRVLDYMEKSYPVSMGCETPMVRPLITAEEVHGQNGMDGLRLPEPCRMPTSRKAVDVMAQVLQESKEPVTLLAIGPLTNIAMLLRTHPELTWRIEGISIMGGAIQGGNKTPAAEFNIYVDPEAADIVFRSGIPITMAGLNVTHRATVFPEDVQRLRALENPVATMCATLIESMMRYHRRFGSKGCHLHDPVALLAITHPHLFTAEDYYVAVETQGEHTRGATVVDVHHRLGMPPNAKVLLDINRDAFVDLLVDCCAQYRLQEGVW